MNIKPEGLTLPDCHCFQKKAAVMNKEIDTVSSLACAEICVVAIEMGICKDARDYYIACILSDIMMVLLSPHIRPSEQEKEFEEVYNRIKPLVMQRLHYTSDKMEEAGVKWG